MEMVAFLSMMVALLSILTSCFMVCRLKKQIAEITDLT